MATREAYAAAAAALILLGACKQRERAKPVEVVPPRPIDARVLTNLPPSTHAAITSAPREQWPCAFDVIEHQGINETGHCVFTYGKRTACRMPAELLAQGVWGCPDRFVRTDSDGMVRDRTFTYDSENRLVDYSGFMHYTFAWDGDRLVSTTSENVDGPHTVTYVDDGDHVLGLEKGELVEELTLQQGRLVQIEEYLYGRIADIGHVHWDGDKPSHINIEVKGPVVGSVQRTFAYDCCEQAIARLSRIGSPPPAEVLEQCRRHTSDPVIQCALDAASDQAAKSCIDDVVHRSLKPSSPGGGGRGLNPLLH